MCINNLFDVKMSLFAIFDGHNGDKVRKIYKIKFSQNF